MKIVIVSSSQREQGESTRIAHWLKDKIQKDGHTTTVLDLHTENLPLWDEGLWGNPDLAEKWSVWTPWAETLQAADAFVFTVPEYHGMVTPVLQNFFMLASAKELGHKPAWLVAVSGGINGAYPIAELRANSTKNNKMCYVPDHLIIRHAGEMLKPETAPEWQDDNAFLQERIDYSLTLLYAYAKALGDIRASGITQTEKFGNGM